MLIGRVNVVSTLQSLPPFEDLVNRYFASEVHDVHGRESIRDA